MNAMHQAWMEEGVQNARPEILAKGMAKGMAEGKAEGKAEVFLRLARSKFRRVSKVRAAQVHAAPMPQLDIWLDRILTATSLNEVFDGDAGDAPAVNGAPAKLPRQKRTDK